MTAQCTTHTHPGLGPLTGIVRSPSAPSPPPPQFRNLPYARIPARFRQSVLVETLRSDQRDCTVEGFLSPQVPQASTAFGGPLPADNVRQYSELDCLSLIVSAPKPGVTER